MRGPIFVSAILLCVPSTAAADDQPICPDRPSKSTGACTVPAGRFQLETDLVDWSHDEATDFTTVGSSLLKYGVSDRADVELGVTPLEFLRAPGEHASGIGDMLLRVKYRLTSEDSTVQAALDPFVKLPTANHRLGNGKVEGGVVMPVSAPLGKTGLTVTVDPELDFRADADGRGRHGAMVQVFNVGASVGGKLSVSAELWGQWDWNPAGTARQASADGSIAYLVGTDVQLDAGANFGLNRETPDVEIYAGISKRF